MNSILLSSLVREFYRRNAGQFVFIFILFFGAVGELEGTLLHTGPLYQFHYQYALILGMLSSRTLLILVLLAWLLYAEKCAQFILSTLQQPDHSFLYLLNTLPPKKMFRLLYRVQLLLFLPVLLYSLAIIGVAVYKGWLFSGLGIPVYILAVCRLMTLRYRRQWQHPGRQPLILLPRGLGFLPGAGASSCWSFFIRYLFRQQRLLLAGIKIFSCGLLYLSAATLSEEDYDPRLPSLLFGLGLLAQGFLVYRLRAFEQKTLLFYRGLPIPLPGRLTQYAILYAVLFIPEGITLCLLTPGSLHGPDALRLLLSGYSLLLLLNSLLFIAPFTMQRFLKIMLCLYLVWYFAVMAGLLSGLALFTLAIAAGLFYQVYYRFDPAAGGASSI